MGDGSGHEERPRESHPHFGLEFDWLAVDRKGHVALMLSSGYGPVPLTVLDRFAEVEDAVELLTGQLSVIAPMPKHDTRLYLTSEPYEAVERGLYVYDWAIYHGPYRRQLVPSVAVTLGELPPPLLTVARFAPLEVTFADAEEVELPYVDVESS
jgi:hypothetical protein